MIRTFVYIGDDLLDLYPDTVVAITLKANEISDPTVRNLNYTNQFRAPFTENNDRLFENARDVRSQTLIPYRRQSCRVVQNGIEVVPNAVAVLKKASSAYEIFILSGAANFFDAINGKMITDIDLSEYNTDWSAATINGLMNETEGVFAPVIDYGKMAYPAGLNSNLSIDTDTYLPSIYYKTVLDKIFSEAGYSTSGTAFSSAKLAKKIIAFSRDKFEYSDRFAESRRFSGAALGTQSIVNPTTAQPVNFPTNKIANATYWDGTNKYTAVDADVPTDVLYQVKVSYTLTITVTGGTVDIQVHNSVGGTNTPHTGVGSGTYTYSELTTDIYHNSFTQIRILTASGTPTITVDRGDVLFEPSLTILRNASFHVYFQYLLPDISQTDFIKDFMIDAGILFSEVDGVIYAKSLNEIIADTANAKDWTTKRANKSDEGIEFTPNYAQNNYFKYDTKDDLVPDNFGRGNLDIDNTTLALEKDVYKSLSANTLTGIAKADSKVFCAIIPAYDLSERSYRITFTGTSGTCNIGVNGINYLATFNTNLNTTASDFVTAHAAALLVLGITLTVVSGAQVQFSHDSEVIKISSANVSGNLNSTPTESSAQKVTDDSEVSNSPGIRYLLVRDKYSFEPTAGNETNTLISNYKVAYFFDPNQTYSMLWDQSLENISYFKEALQKYKTVSRYYVLDETDIAQIDFFTPIFDTDSYYLLNVVENFVPGRVTKCELLKL